MPSIKLVESIKCPSLEDVLPESIKQISAINTFLQNIAKYSSNNLTGNVTSACYNRDQVICVTKEFVTTESHQAVEWAILHEDGHAQRPFMLEAIEISTVLVALLGMHYCNSSRIVNFMKGSMLAAVFRMLAMQLEERRADDWANEYASEEALKGAVEYFQNCRKKCKEKYDKLDFKYIPFGMFQYTQDFDHPSLDSRIAKIKKVLKDRFSK